MKILLINPPYSFKEIGGVKQNFRHVINIIPSLGLAYLAAVAEKNKHTVKIIDCTLGISDAEVVKITQDFKPRLVGITAATPTFKNAVRVISILRKVLPDSIFICGGAHPTACPVESINSNVFDFVILGEGEETFLELISYIEGEKLDSAGDIRGIVFKKNGEFIITDLRPRINNLDSIPYPARHLLPALGRYQPTPASYRRLPIAVIMTSRGCPNRCVFCDRAVFGEKFRKRSVSNIMYEVKEVVYKYGAREIRFFDDTFTIDAGHVEDICRKMRKLVPSVGWTCLTSVNSVNLDMLKMMKDAGCWQVLFGLESGDDYVLKHLGKGNTVKDNRRAVFWAKEAGLRVRADFLIGSPWETKESLMRTVEFAKKLPLDFAHFNKFIPFPGTGIYNILTAQGYRFVFEKGGSINDQTDAVYIPPSFSKAEYIKLLNQAYKKFYLRPTYLLRKLLSIKTSSEFIGHIKGLYSILSL